MTNQTSRTYLVKAISVLTIAFTGFIGSVSQGAQALEQSCDPGNSDVLVGCDFSNQDLSGLSFAGAVVINSDFSGANLTGADFQGTNITADTFSSGTLLQNANFSQANLSGLNLSGINLSGANLTDSNLSEANLTEANLSGANLTGSNLSSANLTNAILKNTNVSNADFTNSDFTGIQASELQNTPIVLPASWIIFNRYLIGPTANLTGVNLSNQNLSGMDLSGANLSNANLYGANLNLTKFIGANLTNVNLNWSDLTNTNFTRADLTGSNLTAAWVDGTNFTKSILLNVSRSCYSDGMCSGYMRGYYYDEFRHRVGLQYSTLDSVVTSNFPDYVSFRDAWDWWCYYYCGLRSLNIPLPSGWVNRNGYLLGPGVKLTNKNFNGWNFSGLNLSNVDISNSQFYGADFSNSNLVNVDFSGKDLRNTNFGSANLTGANFSGADLSGANFNNSTLTGVNFSGTNLRSVSFNNVTSGQIIGEAAALPSGWKLVKGFLVGSTAQLYGADLSGSDLSGMDLSYTSLQNANLESANLTGTNLQGANLNNANFRTAILEQIKSGSIQGSPSGLPSGWGMVRGYLVGPRAILRGVDLRNANFGDLNLSGADFNGAYLEGASFYRANLSDADLSNAFMYSTDLRYTNFTGAKLENTNLNYSRLFNTDFTNATLIGVTRDCYDYWRCGYWDVNGPVILKNTKGWGLRFDGHGVNLPNGWSLRAGVLFGPTANLSGTTINQQNLLNLSGLDLSGADFSSSTLTGVNFTNTNLSSANFTSANLISVNLSNTDLQNANLHNAKSRAISGSPLLPTGWVLANGTLIGAGVQAVNLNLSGMNLEGLDLSGIDLSNSNLTDANLRNVNLTGATLKNANLSGADISGSILEHTDLSGVIFGEIVAQDVTGSPVNVPKGWVLQDGTFIGTLVLNSSSISGTLQLGQVLTVGTSSSPSNVDYSFTWYRDGIAIPDSNNRSHQIEIADLGAKLKVEIFAFKTNFLSASVISDEVFVSNSLPNLQGLAIEGNAAKDGHLALSVSGNVAFSTLTYQVSRDSGKSWANLSGPSYSIQFNDLGGYLNFRVVQSANGYLTQTTNFDPIAVDGSFILPGFSLGSIDGANSGSAVTGGALVGSTLKATKGVWPSGTRVTGFWWSTNGTSVGTKLSYKSTIRDIGAQLVYVEVGVSPEGATKYRLSTTVNVVPNQFNNSSKPTIIGAVTIGSKLKASIGATWASGTVYTYQWLSDGQVIPNAVGILYTITADDIGSSLSVRVCAKKQSFADKCEESVSTDVIRYANIAIAAKPVVKLSSTRVGKQLAVTVGKWLTGVTFQYEWLRDGSVIPNESRNIYVLTNDDTGHAISVRVTGSKAGYFDLTKVSDPKVYK